MMGMGPRYEAYPILMHVGYANKCRRVAVVVMAPGTVGPSPVVSVNIVVGMNPCSDIEVSKDASV